MKCPHCTVEVHPEYDELYLGEDIDGSWSIFTMECPSCNRFIIDLSRADESYEESYGESTAKAIKEEWFVHPMHSNRTPAPQEVPPQFASDYNEASLILELSPKASAALSRRCLQHILREKANVVKSNLMNNPEASLEVSKGVCYANLIIPTQGSGY